MTIITRQEETQRAGFWRGVEFAVGQLHPAALAHAALAAMDGGAR